MTLELTPEERELAVEVLEQAEDEWWDVYRRRPSFSSKRAVAKAMAERLAELRRRLEALT